jgi:glyoxylase-like metal-dependent hydrolase (beta-lactamase superfamily II)
MRADLLPGVTVFERGWLSSNSILLHGSDGEHATLVDTGYASHAEQTLALVRHALRPGQSLVRIVNTHLHSDHCGGNAALARAFGAHIVIPPGHADAVAAWDEDQLTYRLTSQRCDRFSAEAVLRPGESFAVGGRHWQALAAPGHDPHSLILFDAQDGVLISADALWENGFGIVFPELVGDAGFGDVGTVLDQIEHLPLKLVIPGHGAPFTDVGRALHRARARLRGFATDPQRHARHAVKVLIKYHLMEERSMALGDLSAWAVATPLFGAVWQRFPPRGVAAPTAWIEQLVGEMVNSGALALCDEVVMDV